MANLRSLVTIGAVLGSVLMLSLAPAVVGSTAVTPAMAEPQAASRAPLKLAPPRQARTVTRHTPKFKRTARIRVPHRAAQQAEATAERQRDDGTIMRGQDSIGLIAKLPWWRADEANAQRQQEKQAESQIYSASAHWLGAPLADGGAASDDTRATAGELRETDGVADDVTVADAGEINELDLAAAEAPPAPSDKSWFHALLAVLGGAFAAASAARFLLV
jgi:hypothetical protein